MSENSLLKRGIILIVIVLFFGANVTYSIGEENGINSAANAGDIITKIISSESDTATSRTTIYNGSLSGYVNDTSMNPIEGARVRVYFHETYGENYTDSSGYYHVTNIPICYCLKNATCSKEGYKTEWVLLGITENTTYDFILMPLDLHPVFDGTMGENGWYVSCVTITFVYDPEEIAAVYYTLDGGEETLYTELFEVCEDGFHELLWRAVNHEGNWSDPALAYFKIDQTPPTIDINWELYYENGIWYLIITVTCDDATSGVDYVEFYINDGLAFTDNTPPYEIVLTIPPTYSVKGLICGRQFDEQNVSFYALIVKIKQYWRPSSTFSVAVYDLAGNVIKEEIKFDVPSIIEIHLFKRLTFANNYTGRVGIFFINAEFEEGPV